MYSKIRTQKLVDKLAPKIIKFLKLTKYSISISVKHSRTKNSGHRAALTESTPDHSDIFIFYDNHDSKSELIGTLIHELLHVLFQRLHKTIAKSKQTSYTLLEEHTIRNIENLITNMRKIK